MITIHMVLFSGLKDIISASPQSYQEKLGLKLRPGSESRDDAYDKQVSQTDISARPGSTLDSGEDRDVSEYRRGSDYRYSTYDGEDMKLMLQTLMKAQSSLDARIMKLESLHSTIKVFISRNDFMTCMCNNAKLLNYVACYAVW